MVTETPVWVTLNASKDCSLWTKHTKPIKWNSQGQPVEYRTWYTISGNVMFYRSAVKKWPAHSQGFVWCTFSFEGLNDKKSLPTKAMDMIGEFSRGENRQMEAILTEDDKEKTGFDPKNFGFVDPIKV